MADLMTPTNLPSPPPIVGTTPAHLGPLPGSQPQGPIPTLPGVQPYFDFILATFMKNLTPAQITDDALLEMLVRQSMKLAVKIITNFPEFGKTVTLPASPVPHPLEK